MENHLQWRYRTRGRNPFWGRNLITVFRAWPGSEYVWTYNGLWTKPRKNQGTSDLHDCYRIASTQQRLALLSLSRYLATFDRPTILVVIGVVTATCGRTRFRFHRFRFPQRSNYYDCYCYVMLQPNSSQENVLNFNTIKLLTVHY